MKIVRRKIAERMRVRNRELEGREVKEKNQ